MPFVKGKSGNEKGRPTADRLVNPKIISKEEIREKEHFKDEEHNE